MDIANFREYWDLGFPVLKIIIANLIIIYLIFSILFRLNNLIKKNTQKSILMWLKLLFKGIISAFTLPSHIPEWKPSRGLAKGINYSFATIWSIGSILYFLLGITILLSYWYSQKPLSLVQFILIFGLSGIFILGSRFFYVEARKSIALAQNSQVIENNSRT